MVWTTSSVTTAPELVPFVGPAVGLRQHGKPEGYRVVRSCHEKERGGDIRPVAREWLRLGVTAHNTPQVLSEEASTH